MRRQQERERKINASDHKSCRIRRSPFLLRMQLCICKKMNYIHLYSPSFSLCNSFDTYPVCTINKPQLGAGKPQRQVSAIESLRERLGPNVPASPSPFFLSFPLYLNFLSFSKQGESGCWKGLSCFASPVLSSGKNSFFW